MARPVATSAVFVLWVAAACGGSPAPTAPAPQTALPILAKPGIWTGTLDVTACSDSRSRCPAHITDWPQTFSLRMAADGLALSALVETPLLAVPVMLTGSVAPDGSARLAGSYQSSRASGDLRGIEVTELHLRPDPVTGVTGTFAFRHDYTSTVTTLAGTVASASQRRLPTPPRVRFRAHGQASAS